MLSMSLAKEVEFVGGAACRMPEYIRNELSGIPRAGGVGMRNGLVHACLDFKLDVLWQTLVGDLPLPNPRSGRSLS